MATAQELNMGWFRYTADDGTFRAVKTDAVWGAAAASGLTALNAADAPFPTKSKRYSPRRMLFQSAATGRSTNLISGTTAASAWTTAGATVTRFVRGLQTGIVFTKFRNVGERVPRPRTIFAKAQDTAAA
jgi:hypothetical protein